MPDTVEQRLCAAAEATDAVVAGWTDTADLPATRRTRSTRTTRPLRGRRLLYPALSAAAVAAVIAVLAVVVTLTGNAAQRAPAGIGAPGSSWSATPHVSSSTVGSSGSGAAPTSADPPTRATDVLARALVGLRDITPTWYDTGWYVIDAADWQHGVHVASVEVTVYWSAHPYRGNPCVLQNGMVAGHQGAPAPDDVCAARPDPDGTVWIWKMGHSAARPWTTAHTKDWIVSQARADGTVVTVEVTSQIGSHPSGRPIYASTPFTIPVDTLVHIATDSQIGFDGPCTHDCTAFGPPGSSDEATNTTPRGSTHS